MKPHDNTPTNLFSRERFEAWLVNQPMEREFFYCDNRDCLLASFLKEAGCIKKPSVSSTTYRDTVETATVRYPLPEWARNLADSFTHLSPNKPFTTFDAIQMYKNKFGIDLLEMNRPKIEQKENV